MSTLDQIIGRTPVQEDDPPVQTARPRTPARAGTPTDKEEKKLRDRARRSSTVAHIIGMSESDEESIIPDDAKPVDPYSSDAIPGMRETPSLNSASPSEPSVTAPNGEELISPTAALVAPDVTPKVFQLIDPSMVPAPPKPAGPPPGAPTVTPPQPAGHGALDTILGRNTQPSASQIPPVTAESFMQTINPLEIKSKVAEKLVPSLSGGSAMPEHQEGDGKTVYAAFRNIMG
jgi:hypothetical protein